jgi:hypothetical protein
MSAALPDRQEPARASGSDIAQQLRGRRTIMEATVHSCNRLGRIGNLPSIGFAGWWRRRGNRRG